MKKLALPLLAIMLLTSCVEKDTARAERINGLLVFIHSEPLTEYQVIDRLKHDAITETLREGKGKKVGQALGDMLSKGLENANLQDQVYKMTELAKKQHPQAEALIIDDKVFEAQVIKFN